tara:strand:+ start:2603 stop:2944 length:342 start_codon:yes stop_codon:yes gene_type:complete
MATYEYKCEACGHFFTEEISIKKYKRKKKCPSCKKHKLRRILSAPDISIGGESTTLGQLAESNTKKMGRYELEEKQRQDNKELENLKRDTRKTQREINKMTPDQKKKYILGGD